MTSRVLPMLRMLLVLPVLLRAQSAPSAEAIVARHEAATGGRAALDRHSSVHIVAHVEAADSGARGTIETWRAKPDRFVEKTKIQGIGEFTKGYDGTIAWDIDEQGPSLLTDDDVIDRRRIASWSRDFDFPQALRGGRVDSAEFDGMQTWRVTYAERLGLEVYVYFDRETGLRLAQTTLTPNGEATTRYGEYREFGGVKFPTRISTTTPLGESIVTIDTIEFDKVRDDLLALPPSVKALVKRDTNPVRHAP